MEHYTSQLAKTSHSALRSPRGLTVVARIIVTSTLREDGFDVEDLYIELPHGNDEYESMYFPFSVALSEICFYNLDMPFGQEVDDNFDLLEDIQMKIRRKSSKGR